MSREHSLFEAHHCYELAVGGHGPVGFKEDGTVVTQHRFALAAEEPEACGICRKRLSRQALKCYGSMLGRRHQARVDEHEIKSIVVVERLYQPEHHKARRPLVRAVRALAPAKFHSVLALVDYTALERLLFQAALGIPSPSLIFELPPVLADRKPTDGTAVQIAYRNIPFGTAYNTHIPLLLDISIPFVVDINIDIDRVYPLCRQDLREKQEKDEK